MYLCEYFFISDKPSWQWTPRTLASLIKLLVSGGASSSQSEARVGAWWPMRGRVVRELGTILLSGTSPSRTPGSASTLHRHQSGIPASRELFRSRGYNLVNHSHFVLASSPGSLGGLQFMHDLTTWDDGGDPWPVRPKHRVSRHQPSPCTRPGWGTTKDETCQYCQDMEDHKR